MDKKREKLLLFLMALAVLALPALYYAETVADGAESGLSNQHPGIMRFHIIANSNSDADQALKLEVRDHVLEKVQSEMVGAAARVGSGDDYISEEQEMRDWVKGNLPRIEEWAREAIDKSGFGYGASAQIGIRHIPAKYYGDMYFPEGNYEALTITLGEGAGENWWCVMFPPLCLVDSEDPSYREELGIGEEERLTLTFKTLELLGSSDETASASDGDTSAAAFEKASAVSRLALREALLRLEGEEQTLQ